MLPFILLLIGLLLIYIEFYLPGAVLGTLGGILIVVSVFYFAEMADSLLLTGLYILSVIFLVVVLIRFTLKRIVNAKPGTSIYLNSDQEGFVASHYDEKAIGKVGKVLTDLKPGGHILIDGKKELAISESGYIDAGTHVIVVGGDAESLIVKEYKEKSI